MKTLTSLLAGLALLLLLIPASAQVSGMSFKDLPPDAKKYANGIRQKCRDFGGAFKLHSRMQGFTTIDLDGDGSRDLLVDTIDLCNSCHFGANCSNRGGSDVIIWKQVGRRTWKKIFNQHLYRKFLSIGGENGKFQLMAVSIYAGSSQCQPAPGKDYRSSQTCDALVRYRNGKWVWEKIE